MSDLHLNYIPEAGSLADRVILVTGAADGIGRVVAKAYASFGATVVLLDKSIEKLEKVYDEITEAGHPEPAIYPLDMAGATVHDYLDMSRIMEEQLNGLDGLVLNAAWMPGFVPFEQYDLEMWQKTMTINLTANYLITQACLPLLLKSEVGSIVHSAHEVTRAYSGAFGIAKAGMAAMMDIVADEYDNPDRFIRVNSVDSGPLRTEMRRSSFPGENIDTVAAPEAVLGPYLFFMCNPESKLTAQKVSLDKLDADFIWPGLKTEQV